MSDKRIEKFAAVDLPVDWLESVARASRDERRALITELRRMLYEGEDKK